MEMPGGISPTSSSFAASGACTGSQGGTRSGSGSQAAIIEQPFGLAPHVVLLARQFELRLVLTRNRSAKTVEVIAKRDLARQARRLVAIGRAVEEIVLVRTHGRDLPGKLGRDVDVTRRTGTASSAKREQFVETMLADYFHQVEACIRFEGVRFACAVDDRQARRPFDSIKTVQIRNSLADWCAAA